MVPLPDIRVVILPHDSPDWGGHEASISYRKGSRMVNGFPREAARTRGPRSGPERHARKRRTVRRDTMPVTTEAMTPISSTLA